MCMNSSMNIHTPCTEIRPVFIFSTFAVSLFSELQTAWSFIPKYIIICLLRSETGSNPKPHSTFYWRVCSVSFLSTQRTKTKFFFFKLFMTLIFFIFLTLDQFLRKMSPSLKCRIFPHSLNKISHGAGKPHHWRHVFLRMSRQEVCDEACTVINHIIWWSDSGGLC